MSKPSRYRLTSLIINDFILAERDPNLSANQEDLLFKINFSLSWLDRDQSVVCVPTVRYVAKATNKTILNLKFSCTFAIENYSENIIHKEREVEAPDALLLDIFGICANTARGYIFAKTEDTYLRGTFLGTFDPRVFLQNLKDKNPTTTP